MPTPTYTPLANITLASGASSITFSSIPSTYRDLVIVFLGKGEAVLEARIRFNGISGMDYSYVRNSSGITPTSVNGLTNSGFLSVVAQATTVNKLLINIDILDYAQTNKHKSLISRANQSSNGTESFANRWASTAAINSVTILTSTGNWAAGTQAAIYGIVA